jgi:drug/metabolite transporter (DMT)-like permease
LNPLAACRTRGRAILVTIGSHSRLMAILQALLVISLWSSSWVLIKLGLRDIAPLTFAGIRYFVAFLVLAPFALSRSNRQALRGLGRRRWLLLTALGLLIYMLCPGGQYVGLFYLPAVTTSLLFTLGAVTVALLSGVLLRERPTLLQWCGILTVLTGGYLYFHPVDIPAGQAVGIVVVLVSMLGYSFAAILGRGIARSKTVSPVLMTVVSMGTGSVVLLAGGVAVEGLPSISLTNWLLILWLSVVNTSFTFVLWNRTLQTLTAVESNIISNAMLVEIAVWAWLFLGEHLTVLDLAGLGSVIIGTLLVQLRGR